VSSNDLPSSPAAERNKQPILEVLRRRLPPSGRVLEIGAGTGQHAVHFARHLPAVHWQTSELPQHLPLLSARIQQAGVGLPEPIELDVMGDWPDQAFDAVFTANTLHIMPWECTSVLIERASNCLAGGGELIIYGPFHDNGVHTAESNLQFDRMLRSRNPDMGVRDAVKIRNLAGGHGLEPVADISMPANNRILVFRKVGREAPGVRQPTTDQQ
jgi:cyclopropane fatty-acyl-phospholipid synthase-like methyltransferase